MLKISLFVVLFIVLQGCISKNETRFSKQDTSIFEDRVVHVVRIIPPSNKIWGNLVGDKKEKKVSGINHYQLCSLEIDGKSIDSVGIRFKGESSYNYQPNKKKSFKLKFNEFKKGQRFQKLKKLCLNNHFKDPSFMREKLMLDFITSENLPAPRSSYCRVYFGEELLGLYLIVEEIDEAFLKRNFKTKKGKLYNGKPKAWLQVVSDSTLDYSKYYTRKTKSKSLKYDDLHRFITTINDTSSGKQYQQKLDAIFNTESCLKYWAINNFLVNIDAYNMGFPHNYMLYFEPKTDYCHWIGYDYNYGFGGWTRNYNLREIYHFDIFSNPVPATKFPLAVKLLDENPSYQKIYINHLEKILKKVEDGWFSRAIAKNYELIHNEVYEDPYKLYTNIEFDLSIEEFIGDKLDPGAFSPGLKPFITQRVKSVKEQLKLIIH
jgi:spore coat protein H